MKSTNFRGNRSRVFSSEELDWVSRKVPDWGQSREEGEERVRRRVVPGINPTNLSKKEV